VVIRMEPTLKYPFNIRSFFTDKEVKDIGSGIVLWRGYFQSVRPAIGKMLINVDISTGTMYKSGDLIPVCCEYARVNVKDLPQFVANDRDRLKLQRFISGIRIRTKHTEQAGKDPRPPRVVKKMTHVGANKLTFTMREGGQMTVAEYFRRTQNKPLRFPELPCVEVSLLPNYFIF
jgi:eukaryotic translation initiation factor 2C